MGRDVVGATTFQEVGEVWYKHIDLESDFLVNGDISYHLSQDRWLWDSTPLT